MGRPTILRILPRAALQGPSVSLGVELNGTPLKSWASVDRDGVTATFEPRPGLGILKFTWKKDGAIVDEQFLRFFVVL